MKQKHFIDIHKGATAPYVLLLMYYFNQWENVTAWTYLALHGTYGVMWVMKSRIFPDKTWEAECSVWYGFYIWSGLSLYWLTPLIIMTGYFNNGISVTAPPWYLGCCMIMNLLGVFCHYSADMQKHCHLKLNPGSLITDGMMKRCRNINYFGELLIYLGFGLLAMHWIPIAALAAFMVVIWIPNILKKDKSLSRYPEYAEYRRQSTLLIPYIL